MLLAMVTLCALGCYWLTLPTARAYRFISVVKKGDYRRAESMFSDKEYAFPRPYVTDEQARLSKFEIGALTLQQLWQGERSIYISVPYDPDSERRSFSYDIQVRVTAWNVELGWLAH